MDVLESITRQQLEQALAKEYRQYLTGHLQHPQPHLQHIEDDIEIGISHYREFTADKPHVHPVATEHAYVLEGSLRLLLLDGSNREAQYNAGDFFVLQPGVGYATKNAAGTKILFIKSPGTNDKQTLTPTEEVTAWLSAWDV